MVEINYLWLPFSNKKAYWWSIGLKACEKWKQWIHGLFISTMPGNGVGVEPPLTGVS